MTIKEFEEKYNEIFDTPENEAAAAKQLELELADINKQNELFDQGEGHFMEDVHEWDDMIPEEKTAISLLVDTFYGKLETVFLSTKIFYPLSKMPIQKLHIFIQIYRFERSYCQRQDF